MYDINTNTNSVIARAAVTLSHCLKQRNSQTLTNTRHYARTTSQLGTEQNSGGPFRVAITDNSLSHYNTHAHTHTQRHRVKIELADSISRATRNATMFRDENMCAVCSRLETPKTRQNHSSESCLYVTGRGRAGEGRQTRNRMPE